MSIGAFTVLMLAVIAAAVVGLDLLARIETSSAGRMTLAPRLLVGRIAGVLGLFHLDDAIVSSRASQPLWPGLRVVEAKPQTESIEIVSCT